MGGADACSPDGIDCGVFGDGSGKQHRDLFIYFEALRQVFYRLRLFVDTLAFASYRTEDNGYLSASWLSGSIFYCQKQRKSAECFDLMHHNPDVDQHACTYICVDWFIK